VSPELAELWVRVPGTLTYFNVVPHFLIIECGTIPRLSAIQKFKNFETR